MLPLMALPATPVMAAAVMVGPAAAIFTVATAWPLKPVLLSLAMMVTLYVPSTGLAQLTTPAALMLMPAGAPDRL